MTYSTSFDGAAGTQLTSLPGWAATAGYYGVLALDGAGALRVDAYSDDPRSAMNETSSASHYVRAVVGAGYATSSDKVGIAVCMLSRSEYVELRCNSSGVLGLYADTGAIASSISPGQPVVAGDELEIRFDKSTNVVIIKRNGAQIFSIDASYYTASRTGTATGVLLNYNGSPALADVFRSWESGPLVAGADTTPPTLSAATATATGQTTITGGVTTTEAGPAWAVLTSSTTKPSAAQIKAGQNASGVASPAATATLVVGANPGVFAFTGLTASTGYYLHVTQDDTATTPNTAAPVTSALVTTNAAPGVITLPVLRNNTGTLLAYETGATVHAYAVATGNKVVSKTGQVTDAAGVMVVSDMALVAGIEYRCVIVLASGAEGLQKATAA